MDDPLETFFFLVKQTNTRYYLIAGVIKCHKVFCMTPMFHYIGWQLKTKYGGWFRIKILYKE